MRPFVLSPSTELMELLAIRLSPQAGKSLVIRTGLPKEEMFML